MLKNVQIPTPFGTFVAILHLRNRSSHNDLALRRTPMVNAIDLQLGKRSTKVNQTSGRTNGQLIQFQKVWKKCWQGFPLWLYQIYYRKQALFSVLEANINFEINYDQKLNVQFSYLKGIIYPINPHTCIGKNGYPKASNYIDLYQ